MVWGFQVFQKRSFTKPNSLGDQINASLTRSSHKLSVTGLFPSRGFSLMEMMIVLAIMGLFLVFGTRKMMKGSEDIKASVRRFSTLMKKIRNKARVQNKTFRLVFDLPEEGSKKEQSYWVESTNRQALLMTSEELEELSEELEDIETEDGKTRKPDPQGFLVNQQIIKKPPAFLPKGLFFESIELDGDPIEKIQKGQVYIYFFPQGYVQSCAIHLGDRKKLHWTLAVRGITGRVDIYPGNRPLKEIKVQRE